MIKHYHFILCAWVFCRCVCLYTLGVPGALRDQKILGSLELELWMVVRCHVLAEILVPLAEQPVSSTADHIANFSTRQVLIVFQLLPCLGYHFSRVFFMCLLFFYWWDFRTHTYGFSPAYLN